MIRRATLVVEEDWGMPRWIIFLVGVGGAVVGGVLYWVFFHYDHNHPHSPYRYPRRHRRRQRQGRRSPTIIGSSTMVATGTGAGTGAGTSTASMIATPTTTTTTSTTATVKRMKKPKPNRIRPNEPPQSSLSSSPPLPAVGTITTTKTSQLETVPPPDNPLQLLQGEGPSHRSHTNTQSPSNHRTVVMAIDATGMITTLGTSTTTTTNNNNNKRGMIPMQPSEMDMYVFEDVSASSHHDSILDQPTRLHHPFTHHHHPIMATTDDRDGMDHDHDHDYYAGKQNLETDPSSSTSSDDDDASYYQRRSRTSQAPSQQQQQQQQQSPRPAAAATPRRGRQGVATTTTPPPATLPMNTEGQSGQRLVMDDDCDLSHPNSKDASPPEGGGGSFSSPSHKPPSPPSPFSSRIRPHPSPSPMTISTSSPPLDYDDDGIRATSSRESRAISPYDSFEDDEDMDDDNNDDDMDDNDRLLTLDANPEVLHYGGVYYGSDGENETTSHRHIDKDPRLNGQEVPPVYGGVYYGSDNEDDNDDEEVELAASVAGASPSSAAAVTTTAPAVAPSSPSRATVHVNPPPMDYFAGIQRTSHNKLADEPTGGGRVNRRFSAPPNSNNSNNNTNTTNNNTNNNNKHYSVSDRSVTSSLTNESIGDLDFHSVASSSIMSFDEREWQRRNREDYLHPVTEHDDDGPGGGG